MNPDVYLAAIRLPPSLQRTRLLDELVRDARWRAVVEARGGELAGIEAGRATFDRAAWDRDMVEHRAWKRSVAEYEARKRA